MEKSSNLDSLWHYNSSNISFTDQKSISLQFASLKTFPESIFRCSCTKQWLVKGWSSSPFHKFDVCSRCLCKLQTGWTMRGTVESVYKVIVSVTTKSTTLFKSMTTPSLTTSKLYLVWTVVTCPKGHMSPSWVRFIF